MTIYFVWLKGYKDPEPVKWYDGIPMDTHNKPRYPEHMIIRKEEITEEESKLSLDELSKRYPLGTPTTT